MDVRRPRSRRQDRHGQAEPGRRPRRAASCRSRATSTTASPSPASSPRPTRSSSSTRSTRPASRGRRPPRSRSSTPSGTPPTSTILPVGNAGNITAYWRGYREYATATVGRGRDAGSRRHQDPADVGLPGGRGGADRRSATPSTIPRPWRPRSGSATRRPGGRRRRPGTSPAAGSSAVTDEQILAAHRLLASTEGVFVEPGSAASIAGLLKAHEAGQMPARRHGRLHRHRSRSEGPAMGPANRGRLRGRPGEGAGRRHEHRRRARSRRLTDGDVVSPASLAARNLGRGRVPASSANLGPGFDSIGLALGVWDRCVARVTGRHRG